MAGWRKLCTSDIALILYKGDNLQTIYFTEKAREVTTFYALQMP
jgi:hypothetical protein